MTVEPQAIQVRADIEIDAGGHDTFLFLRNIKNLSWFMSHVKDVQAVGNNRYFWRVEGPAGIDFNWEADVFNVVEEREFTWRAVSDAQVQGTGSVKFLNRGENKTQVVVSHSYVSPVGPKGHTLATMSGLNPELQLQAGLLKCKQLLEHRIAAVSPPRGPAGTEQDGAAARYSTPAI